MCIRDRYGVEWDLLKLVESYLIEAPSSEEYRKLITACPSEEWRETMQDVYKRQALHRSRLSGCSYCRSFS